MTTFSALIPIYNNWRFLRGCVESVLSQSTPFDQVVLVDDCSTEPEIRAYLAGLVQCSNVRVVLREENGGIVEAQNDGLRHCTSEFVSFIDCDDVLRSNALELVRQEARKNRADYFFSDREHIDENGAPLGKYEVGSLLRAHGRGLTDLLLDHMVASHLKTIRLDLLTNVGLFAPNTDGVQDWDIALKASEIGVLRHIASDIYLHRLHAAQTSTEVRIDNFRNMNNVRREALRRRGFVESKSDTKIEVAISAAKRVHRLMAGRLNELKSDALVGCSDGAALIIRGLCTSLMAVSELATYELSEGDIVIVMCSSKVNIGALRYAKGIAKATTCLFVFNNQWSIAMAQWYNSYFDLICTFGAEAEIGVSGTCWDGLRLLGAVSD